MDGTAIEANINFKVCALGGGVPALPLQLPWPPKAPSPLSAVVQILYTVLLQLWARAGPCSPPFHSSE